MQKILSRSKHEEVESNSSLQIRSQKERRAKIEEKWSIAKFGFCSTVHSSSTVHPAAHVLLYFTLLLFLLQFFVSSHFVLVIAFSFSFFCNFIYTEHLYKPQSVQTCTHFTFGNRRGGSFTVASSFSHFLSFSFSLSRLPNTPLRMTTQRMVG